MNTPKYIIIHHTAVSREVNEEQFHAVDRYHRWRGWGGIGYHWFIEPDGALKKGRNENINGAHCYQRRMNSQSIGICLTGHFDYESPTQRQIDALRSKVQEIRRRYDIPEDNVVGHRTFAPKSCPGKHFTRQMIKEIATTNMTKYKELIERLKGKLLLQVQDRGKLWYVSDLGTREYLGTGYLDYRKFMKRVREGKIPALGISNEDIEKIPR